MDHITGIDPSSQRVELARRKLTKLNPKNVTFELGSSDDIGRYGEDVFDVVYMNAVFHWITDKEEGLNNIYRTLKPGGKLSICTAEKDHPFTAKMILNTVEKYPVEYARVQTNLGLAYTDLANVSDKEANAQNAFNAYNKSLEIYTVEKYPIGYANTQNNLGPAKRLLL